MAGSGPYRVAIIADAHFHDPMGDFGGVGIDLGGERLALRSWTDTESGPRAVNESAAALKAALDRVVERGITHVVLAGDYTDDGQAENTRRLAALLHHYQDRFSLRFHAIPGNHDLFGPHGKHVSTRFVTAPGKSAPVTSDPDQDPGAIVTPAMRCEGILAALMPMAAFGLFRRPDHLHWETPFGLEDAPEARLFEAWAADGSVSYRLMDASYLVEPEPGLWLLMIDANVFEPRPGRRDPARKKAFLDPTDAGWNAVLRVRPYLLPWIASVTARASELGKTLVAVSHYPVLDPFRDEAGSAMALFGPTALVRRAPSDEVAHALVAAGLRWHAGGHLHVNATTRMATGAGTLTDVALPSLVACPSAFKIIHARAGSVGIETVTLDDLPLDGRIAALYAAEGRSATDQTFGPFLADQYRSRVATRRVPAEWPPHLSERLREMTVADLVSQLGGADTSAMREYRLAELVADACLLREAGSLALGLIDPFRLQICGALAREFGDRAAHPMVSDAAYFRRFLFLLQVSIDRAKADGGLIDLDQQ